MKKVTKEDIHELLVFLNNKENKKFENINNIKSLKYTIDLNNENSLNKIKKDLKSLKLLIDLQYLNNGKLGFKKINEFDFEHTSSGEKHLLFTLIGIISKIEAESLIIIDEPELSLHPNWQTQYINALKDIFKDYSNAHFILGTHSHFMVSDVDKNNASLIEMKLEKSENEYKRKSQVIEANTFGWSVEDILYRIFLVKTTRNQYIQKDIYDLLTLIQNNNTKDERIYELYRNLSRLELNKNDPLIELLEKVKVIIDAKKD